MSAAPRPNCSADGLDACGPDRPPASAIRLCRACSCVIVFSSFSSHAPLRSHSSEPCVPCAHSDPADPRAASASLPQRVPLACAIAPRSHAHRDAFSFASLCLWLPPRCSLLHCSAAIASIPGSTCDVAPTQTGSHPPHSNRCRTSVPGPSCRGLAAASPQRVRPLHAQRPPVEASLPEPHAPRAARALGTWRARTLARP